jgi:hypothetical protein
VLLKPLGNPENYYQAIGVIADKVVFIPKAGYQLEAGALAAHHPQ